MNEFENFYSISWKNEEQKINSVFVGNLSFAIRLYLGIRKRNKTTQLHMFPAQSSACITIFGGRK